MNFSQRIETFLGLDMGQIQPGLERIRLLLGALGTPQNKFPTVHITGSNGKGSTAKIIELILRKSGAKTGLYLSPHVCDFNERIQISGSSLSDSELRPLYESVRQAVEDHQLSVTFFEFVTAMAFVQFRNSEVDIGVIEVGMGGAWDATNVISPLVSLVLEITVEHTEYLGDDLSGIAAEKCGIIKPGVPVVTTAKNEIVAKTVDRVARSGSSPVYRNPDRFRVEGVLATPEGTEFDFHSESGPYPRLQTRLAGQHQAVNAAAAVQTSLLLKDLGFSVDETSIRSGLMEAPLPGRFERVWSEPLTICDGAHNPSAIRALVDTLKTFYPNQRFTFVVGILRHKNETAILRILSRIADRFVFVKPNSPRAIPPDKLQAIASGHSVPCEVIPSVEEAMRHVLEEGGGPIFVTGSFYTVGEVKQFFRTKPTSKVVLI